MSGEINHNHTLRYVIRENPFKLYVGFKLTIAILTSSATGLLFLSNEEPPQLVAICKGKP